MIILIPVLFLISFSGLTYVLLKAFVSGAEVYSDTYAQETASEFEDIFLFIPPRRIAEIGWSLSAAVFIVIFMLLGSFRSASGLVIGLLIASLAGYGAFHAPKALLRFLKKRRLSKFNNQLVDTLVNMSNALRAGFSITQAFETVVKDKQKPIAQEFDVFLQQTRVGVSFEDALQNLDERVDSDDLTLVVGAIETARRTGGNLTEILEKIAQTIRERMRIENRIRTLTAQGKLQGIIAASMPVVIGVLLMMIEPEMMRPFLESTAGAAVIGIVTLLILCGWLIIRKIINIDV